MDKGKRIAGWGIALPPATQDDRWKCYRWLARSNITPRISLVQNNQRERSNTPC